MAKQVEEEEERTWQSCAKWLCALDILPSNHKVLTEDATIRDLAYTLRDGVLLCNIATSIDENSINPQMVQTRPQMAQFLCLKNIRLFLSACQKTFGLKDADLFEASMLYDFTDFAMVLQTLSELSKSPKFRSVRPEVASWPQEESEPAKDLEEDIYKRLEDLTSEQAYQEFYYQHHGGNAYGFIWGKKIEGSGNLGRSSRQYAQLQYYDEEKSEEIYADLGLVKKANQIRSNRRSQSAAAILASWNFDPKEERDYCLQELIETEANYVDVLNLLRKNFIRPITTINECEKKLIFINVKELGDIHTAFYSALFNCVTAPVGSHKKVGDVFIEFKEKFLKYADYCSGLPKASCTLEQLCTENKEVLKEIERCENSAQIGCDKPLRIRLRDLLAVPMQRILKYHLLLAVMVKSTPENHEDYRSYFQAHETMLDVSTYINEAKRDAELIHNIKEIQKSITMFSLPENMTLIDYGRLKKDGELKVQSHESGSGSKLRSRYIFLFNKLILMSKSVNNESYKLKESLSVEDYKVQELPGAGQHESGTSVSGHQSSSDVVRAAGRRVMRRDSSRWSHAFLLVHVKQQNVYTIFARTAEEKSKWMEAFHEAYVSNHLSEALNSNHDLHMGTFEKPQTCDVCFTLLKGLFYQGYRCLKCARVVHQNCAGSLPSCGRDPPALPPRPSLMQMPSVIRNGGDSLDESRDSADESNFRTSRLDRQGSDTSNTSLVLPTIPNLLPPTSNTLASRSANPDYINTRIEEHSWYVGNMDRETANSQLRNFPSGSFLVRCGRLGYALSLKHDTDVKHMKIESHDDFEDCMAYFFSETHKFTSIVEMIAWYSNNSLKESFQGLDNILQFPLKDLSLVEARYDFSPASSEQDAGNQLPLKKGERVTVLDKMDENSNWWKAHNGYRCGYIPKNFVIEL